MTAPAGSDPRRRAQAAGRIVELADTLLDDLDVAELLDRLVIDCVEVLGASAGGIVLRGHDGSLLLSASSDERAHRVGQSQLLRGEGPAIDAIEAGTPVRVDEPAVAARRWPAIAEEAAAVGFTQMHAVPLRLRAESIGALTLYDTGSHTIADEDRLLAQALADVVTIAIVQYRSLSRAAVLVEQLQVALHSRVTLEQAKGIVSQYGHVDIEQAFAAIRAYARANQSKLGDVAGRVVRRELSPRDVLTSVAR